MEGVIVCYSVSRSLLSFIVPGVSVTIFRYLDCHEWDVIILLVITIDLMDGDGVEVLFLFRLWELIT